MLAPRGDGIGLVEADGERDRLPEPLDVGLAEDPLGPALVREGDRCPVDQLLVEDDPAAQLLEFLRNGAPDALAVHAREQVGLGVARDRDVRRLRVAERLHPRQPPGRAPVEHVVGRALDERLPHVRVAVVDVHVARAGGVRGPRERPNERRVREQPADGDDLTGRDVGADPHGELGIPIEPLVHGVSLTPETSTATRVSESPSAARVSGLRPPTTLANTLWAIRRGPAYPGRGKK